MRNVWDTLVRTTGNPSPTIAAQTNLFGNANVGQLALTNLQVAGQLASDQTYVILAIRAWLFFRGTNAFTNYVGVSSQLYLTLQLGDKPQFTAPTWYFPSGGGIYGSDPATENLNLGYPSQNAILKLARPIVLPVRQNFFVNCAFFPIGSTDVRTTLNSGATDDQKVIMVVLDGLNDNRAVSRPWGLLAA